MTKITGRTISLFVLVLVIIVTIISLYILLGNYLKYNDTKGITPNETSTLAEVPTPLPYTGAHLTYHLLESSGDVSYRFTLDPRQMSLAGMELAFLYNTVLLSDPVVTASDSRVSLPTQLQEKWSLSNDMGAYHVVTFLKEEQQPFASLDWVTVTFRKKESFTARGTSATLFIPLDSSFRSSNQGIPVDWSSTFTSRQVKTKGTLLYTSFGTNVQVTSETYTR